MKRFALEIAEEKCRGCMTCEVACKQENEAPDGVKLIYVSEDGPRQEGGGPVKNLVVLSTLRLPAPR